MHSCACVKDESRITLTDAKKKEDWLFDHRGLIVFGNAYTFLIIMKIV